MTQFSVSNLIRKNKANKFKGEIENVETKMSGWTIFGTIPDPLQEIKGFR